MIVFLLMVLIYLTTCLSQSGIIGTSVLFETKTAYWKLTLASVYAHLLSDTVLSRQPELSDQKMDLTSQKGVI